MGRPYWSSDFTQDGGEVATILKVFEGLLKVAGSHVW